jgi:phage terminase large subunit-like protein
MNGLPATWPNYAKSLRHVLKKSSLIGAFPELLADATAAELEKLRDSWQLNARSDQFPPDQAHGGGPWTAWIVMGGRGAGKTRTGAEWIKGLMTGDPDFTVTPVERVALIGETAADVRDVMVEGVSGILAIHNHRNRPTWEPSRRRLEWPNGGVAQIYSAEDPESLRGPQFECAWLDEFAKWRYAEETFDMLQFGLRLGAHPRQVITTTPRSSPIIKRLLQDPRSAISRAATIANAENLAPDFLQKIVARYAGTRLGRQELDGQLLEDDPSALWSRASLDGLRETRSPGLARIVVAIDPPASSTQRADACGILAAGIAANGLVYVLEDASLNAARPSAWARVAIALYHKWEADELVAEVNQGGEMVAAVISEADEGVPVTMVRATRGKYLRAAPVAQLYEQGRVRHAGVFRELEDEMCAFGPEGLPGGKSPDRLDALVWAVTALALGKKPPEPRMRRV